MPFKDLYGYEMRLHTSGPFGSQRSCIFTSQYSYAPFPLAYPDVNPTDHTA